MRFIQTICILFMLSSCMMGCAENVLENKKTFYNQMKEMRKFLGIKENRNIHVFAKKSSISVAMDVSQSDFLKSGINLENLANHFGYENKKVAAYFDGEVYCHNKQTARHMIWHNGVLTLRITGWQRDKKMCPGNLTSRHKVSEHRVDKLKHRPPRIDVQIPLQCHGQIYAE